MAGSSVGQQLTALELSTSKGYGNYNAGFFTFTAKNWNGLTSRSNVTWGRALGTGTVNQSGSSSTVIDPWDLHAAYGPQGLDCKFVFNTTLLYQSPFFKGQMGVLGRVLGGWSIAPLFTAQSGQPLQISVTTGSNSNAQSFGEVYGNGNTANENAVLITKFTGGNSAHYNVTVPSGCDLNGNPSRGGSGINMFSDPNAICTQFRRPILGLDTTDGGACVIRGFPTWNLDATVAKEIRVTERIGATLIIQFSNLLNLFQPANPSMNIDSPQTWELSPIKRPTPTACRRGRWSLACASGSKFNSTWIHITPASRNPVPAPDRLASFISEYLRESTTPDAPAAKAALTA